MEEVKQVDNTEQVKAPSDYLEALPAEIREVLNEALTTQGRTKESEAGRVHCG